MFVCIRILNEVEEEQSGCVYAQKEKNEIKSHKNRSKMVKIKQNKVWNVSISVFGVQLIDQSFVN